MTATTTFTSYEQAREQHRGNVPDRYNIAVDVCDRHPREKLAMIHEDFGGRIREVGWGELQDDSNRFANVLRAHGVEPGHRVAMLLPPTPETAAAFFGVWKAGAILLSMSVLYGDEGIRHRVSDSRPKVLLTNEANAGRIERDLVEHLLILDDRSARDGIDRVRAGRHGGRRPGPALLLLGHHRAGQGNPPRPPLHPRPRGVHLLPRPARRRVVPWHGRMGLGGRDLPADRPVAARGGAGRLPARGRVRPAQAARLPLPPRREERVRYADRDPLDDVDHRRRHPLPAEVPDRVLGRRAAQSRGDPLVPRAVRHHRARLLRPHRVLSAVRQLPVHGGPRGLDGPADAGLGGGDPRRGRASGGERGEICLKARSNPHYPLGYWNRPPEDTEEAFGGDWFHTKDAARADEEGYFWYEGRRRRDHLGGYRIGPFEVESACLEHPAVAEAAAVASPDERRGNVVKAFVVLAAGHDASPELAEEIKAFVRDRHSAYAYPRLIEFVPDLPKTLTGKIRRIDLREQEEGQVHGSD